MNKQLKITDKQKRFCDEYLIDFNGTQAAIRAGYSKKTANEQASRLLTNVNIQEYIKCSQQKTATKLEVTRERIIEEYAKIAFFDIRKLFDGNSRLKYVQEFDDATASALSSVEVDEIWGSSIDGKTQIGDTKKVKLWDKKGALDSLCKMLGFNAPTEVKGEITFSQMLIESGLIDE